MKKLIEKIIPYTDIFLVPFVFPAAWFLKKIRIAGLQRLPLCKKALLWLGVFPIRSHYYEPQFDMRDISKPFSKERDLPGIDWNFPKQLEILEQMTFSKEIENIPGKKVDDLHYHFNNDTFESGDAEYWYQLIRMKKPKRIFEIGSGYSTLLATRAIQKNKEENPDYACKHVCIEPYEMPWLEKTGALIVRKKVEEVNLSFFSELGENDILFIDSSHIIRPQGDVLCEYLEILPRLGKGVIVHLHDIFSPRNYPHEWLALEVKFWNEQYLLEAFLTQNPHWEIVGSLNYLHYQYYEALKRVCPFLSPDREPGSFYIQKTD